MIPAAANPHDVERTLIASYLAQPTLLDAHRIAPEALVSQAYAELLSVMLRLRLDGQRITAHSVTFAAGAHVRETVAALRETPVELDVGPIVKHLQTQARAREFAAGARQLSAYAERGDLAGCRDVVGRMMLTHDAGDQAQPVMTFRELLTRTVEVISAEGAAGQTQIPVGMPIIDASYKLSPGSMLVVGAQTNVGKTSLIVTWMLSIAGRGTPVGIVSVEDPPEDFGAKALGSLTGINPTRMWSGSLGVSEWRVLQERGLARADAPISFAHVASRKLDEVLARVEFMARVRGCRVVAVDYLQAIAHRSGKDARERINSTIEELISLCGRLGVALVLCSQLARPDKGSPFKEPHLIDLKESGEIENRAQCVVMLWRENDTPNAPVKAKIAKAKRQPAGVRFTLARDPDTGMLVEAESLANFGEAPTHDDEDRWRR